MPQEKTPDRRAVYSAALSRSIEVFTSESGEEISEVMSNGLWPIAGAVDIDRVNIYNLLDVGSDKRFGQVYHWDRSKGGTAAVTDELKILPNHPAVEQWIETCTKGNCVNIHTSIMSADEAAFMGAFGVKSMLLAPVFVHDEVWGAVAFQDHMNERLFDDECKELLMSVARLCAIAFVKEEKTQALKRSKDLTDTLNKMAGVFLSQSGKSYEDMMTAGGRLLADLADLDRISVFRNFMVDGVLHGSQIYRWDRVSGGTSAPNRAFAGVTYAQMAPTWEYTFKLGNTVNYPVSKMPEREAATFSANGSLAVFAAPVHIDDAFWGFVLFEDRHKERVFDDDLAETMRSAAFLFSNAVMRAEMERDIICEKDLTRTLIDAAPVGLIIRDKDFNIVDCNDAVLEIFGSVTKQYCIEHYFDFSPEYQPDGLKSMDKIKDFHGRVLSGEQLIFEWMYRSLEGEPIPCELKLTRVEYNNEYMELVYLYDLRSIRKMEKEVAEAEKTQLLIDAMPLCCTLIDRNFTILMCNDSAVRLFKAASKEEVITNFYDLAPETQPDGRPSKEAAVEYIGKAYAEGRFLVEWTHKSIDGELIPCEVTLVRVQYKGEYVVAGYMYDLRSQIKLVELTKKQAEAEAASHAKSSFLANMSHEIRTPMNAIIGMTAIGCEADDVQRKNYALERIDDAAKHLLNIINDVLDISKIEANKLELSPIEFHFETMLDRIVNIITFRVQEKHQRFTVGLDGNIPRFIVGDDQRLSQIIINLLSNAVKFSPEGGEINLSVSLAGEQDGVCELRVEVSDNGIGISAEQQAKLFGAFEQAESGISREFGGTGLGLAISKRIVDLMGGEIWIESELGKGARFIFTVKAGRGTKTDHQGSPKSKGPEAGGKTSGEKTAVKFTGKHILVAEDVEINREIISALLASTDIGIDFAETGLQAVEMAAALPGKYDAMLMDVHMPKMDGLEATRRIRAMRSPGAKKLPIIAMTANVFKSDIDECFSAGMDDHIGKPLEIGILLEKLHEYLMETE